MRTFIKVALFIAVATGIFFVTRPKAAQTEEKQHETLGASVNITPTAPPITSSPAASRAPQQTYHATCSTVASTATSLTKGFMNAHQQRNATQVISLISTPSTDDETTQQSILLGTDTTDGPRLYVLTQFAYKTTAYRLGAYQQNGQDSQERGAMRCTYQVYESRTFDGSSGHTEDTVTRYVDFSVDDQGNIKLTAFRDSLNGSKYSGFN